jgi:hypothetical protein
LCLFVLSDFWLADDGWLFLFIESFLKFKL